MPGLSFITIILLLTYTFTPCYDSCYNINKHKRTNALLHKYRDEHSLSPTAVQSEGWLMRMSLQLSGLDARRKTCRISPTDSSVFCVFVCVYIQYMCEQVCSWVRGSLSRAYLCQTKRASLHSNHTSLYETGVDISHGLGILYEQIKRDFQCNYTCQHWLVALAFRH